MNTNLSTPAKSSATQNGAPQVAARSARFASRPASPGVAAIDALLWRLEARGGVERSLIVGVTGCGADAGATTVATNLALSAGAQGCRTLLVRTAVTARNARGAVEPGLWDILSGDVSPKECQPTELSENVFTLGGGGQSAGATRVNQPLVAELLEELRSQYEVVIIDLPPAESLGSALPLAKQLPGVLLVVCAEQTPQRDAQRSLERLAEDGVLVLGTVLNQCQEHIPRWLRRWF